MAKKTCIRGHIYDSSLYGDKCPHCPSQGTDTVINDGRGNTAGIPGKTEVHPEGKTHAGGASTNIPTILMGDAQATGGNAPGGTVIRPVDGGTPTPAAGRKLTGLLVTYDATPDGQVFKLYEGRNIIGRDAASTVCIPGDSQISGKHLVIRYLEGVFKFQDELSSNGTYVNGALAETGELNTFDVIRIGSTRLLFIAIPPIQ
ncbi:MAG: FHA domain-containing protein [Tannerella sp.]|jgi:hypothetical protein|nr:FHA domain-containing protein [Tannerella sp.]